MNLDHHLKISPNSPWRSSPIILFDEVYYLNVNSGPSGTLSLMGPFSYTFTVSDKERPG